MCWLWELKIKRNWGRKSESFISPCSYSEDAAAAAQTLLYKIQDTELWDSKHGGFVGG